MWNGVVVCVTCGSGEVKRGQDRSADKQTDPFASCGACSHRGQPEVMGINHEAPKDVEVQQEADGDDRGYVLQGGINVKCQQPCALANIPPPVPIQPTHLPTAYKMARYCSLCMVARAVDGDSDSIRSICSGVVDCT